MQSNMWRDINCLYRTFTNLQHRVTIDLIMHKVSKTTRKSTSPPTPRFKPVWLEPDRKGLSINACMEKRVREDMCSNGAPRSGKTHFRCKNHYRFPDCKTRFRVHRLPDGTPVCEQTGEHAHNPNNEIHSGLS